MPIDRQATVKKAEGLVQAGKLEPALAEYARVFEEYPDDFSVANALGDLYVRLGQKDRAADVFSTIGDVFRKQGFVPKAVALYKKALKARAGDEHALASLAMVAVHQELFADARLYLGQLLQHRRLRGDVAGVSECQDRLAALPGRRVPVAPAPVPGPVPGPSVAPPDAPEPAPEPAPSIAPESLNASRDLPLPTLELEVFGRPPAAVVDGTADGNIGDGTVSEGNVADGGEAGDGDDEGDATDDSVELGDFLDDLNAVDAEALAPAVDLSPSLVAALPVPTLPVVALPIAALPAEAPAVLEPPDDAVEAEAPAPVPVPESMPAPAPGQDLAPATVPVPDSASAPRPAVAQESARTPTPTPAEASVPRATADAESDAAPDLLRAAAELEAAAASPTLRFQASAQLGRLWIRHGDLPRGIEWLERATETLAPVPEHGIAAQYDLGETLERVGRTDRALEVFRNLEMDASDYRDVRARIARLEQAGPSGHGA